MITKRIKVYGIVQGVGMRPTVARHAASLGIKGSVSNLGPYVEIYAQGEETQVDKFIDLIRNEPPKRAAILKMDVKVKDAEVYDDFSIIESAKTSGEIFVSPDIAICDECLTELYPEIIAMSLAREYPYTVCRPVVIGDAKMMEMGVKSAKVELQVRSIEKVADAQYERGVIDVLDLKLIDPTTFAYGEVQAQCGRQSCDRLRAAPPC